MQLVHGLHHQAYQVLIILLLREAVAVLGMEEVVELVDI
jgi:hypothetical protein